MRGFRCRPNRGIASGADCPLWSALGAFKIARMTTPSHAELLREYLEQLSQPGAESRLPVWTDWVRLRSLGSAMAIGAALTLAACDSDTDPVNGNGNVAGGAGVGQLGTGGMNMTALYAAPMTGGTGATTATGSGGMNMTALYAAPMTGGTSANTATGSGGMNMTALYAVMMTGGAGATASDAGGSSAGGVSAGTRYAVPLGGSGGQSAGQGGSGAASATGGTSMAALYMAPMEKTVTPAVGPNGG
jgi:hypothetical protein